MTTPEPLWDAKRMGEACKRNAERRERMRPKPSFDAIIKFAYEATLAEMRDEYEAERAAHLARIAELEAAAVSAIGAEQAQEWEEVPRGTYYTFHRDGYITYGPLDDGRQLSVSQIKKSMKIFVGTLPDGWQLMRRKAGAAEAAQP